MKRTLRVFLSNTVHDQEWQKQQEAKPEGEGAEGTEGQNGAAAAPTEAKPVDMENGKNIPGWVLRVEGRLLDVSSCPLFIDAQKLIL